MNNNFSQNNASYGPDTGSFPTKLKIMNKQKLEAQISDDNDLNEKSMKWNIQIV